MTLLQLTNVSRSFGSHRVLDGVNVSIDRGVTGLLGANGAGKSTLMKIALGLIAADAGDVRLLGHDPRSTASDAVAARERVGYAPEHDCLPRRMSAAEFVAYLARVSGLGRTAARSRASDTLRLVGLYEERHRAMSTYSTGMRQRVKLAQALVHDPHIVLLDEPTGGLDPNARRDMLDLIATIGSTLQIGIVMSTHLMGDVERACDAIVVLDGARITRNEPLAAAAGSGLAPLHIDLAAGTDAFASLATERGLSFSREHHRIIVDEAADAELDLIRDVAADSGARIHRLVRAHRSLSSIMQSDASEKGGSSDG